ncbi:protein of unknown function [Nitrospina watsonii]|uniref:Uncharacterized protein n=1 Tax=Nitrospina watsonii TaxID=1323948 RepID=A0ABM9HAC4_9BACT|nr:protein of unknown function [Nitrospina watsonii]
MGCLSDVIYSKLLTLKEFKGHFISTPNLWFFEKINF